MSCQPQIKARKGFTLVEILVVLVIISIMTGLLITVIDPVRQRERARDGTIVSTVNKIVAAITAHDSAVGHYPSCAVLTGGEISNVAAPVCTTGANGSEGSFSINGIVTPETCDANGLYSGTGTGACKFRYENNTTSTGTVCIGAKLHLETDINNDGTSGLYLVWDSGTGAIVDSTTASCNAIP